MYVCECLCVCGRYKQDMYLWEIMVMTRKGLLSIIGVGLSTDPRSQVMLGLLLIFVCTILHAKFQPFTSELMNVYEFISLTVSALTFFVGVFTMNDSSNTAVTPEDQVSRFFSLSLDIHMPSSAISRVIRFDKINRIRL